MESGDVEPRAVRLARKGIWAPVGGVSTCLVLMVVEWLRDDGDVMSVAPGAIGALVVGCVGGLCLLPVVPRWGLRSCLYLALLNVALINTVIAAVRMFGTTEPPHTGLAAQTGVAAICFLAAVGVLVSIKGPDGRTRLLSLQGDGGRLGTADGARR